MEHSAFLTFYQRGAALYSLDPHFVLLYSGSVVFYFCLAYSVSLYLRGTQMLKYKLVFRKILENI